MFTIRLDVKGVPETRVLLAKYARSLHDWSPEMREIKTTFKKFLTRDVFESEGAVFGRPWKPLSPTYRDFKRVTFSGRGILQRSGDLRKGWMFVSDDKSVTMENTVDYGIYHQSTRPRKKLPRRPLLHIDQARQDYIVDTLRKGMIKRLKDLI